MFKQLMQQQMQRIKITPQMEQQFFQRLKMMSNSELQRMVSMARQQGISEEDIQTGLNAINNMRGR